MFWGAICRFCEGGLSPFAPAPSRHRPPPSSLLTDLFAKKPRRWACAQRERRNGKRVKSGRAPFPLRPCSKSTAKLPLFPAYRPLCENRRRWECAQREGKRKKPVHRGAPPNTKKRPDVSTTSERLQRRCSIGDYLLFTATISRSRSSC